MRIGYLSGTLLPSRAASAVHVVNMCQALGDAGHEVVLYGLDGGMAVGIDEFYALRPSFRTCLYGHTTLPGGGYRFALKCLLSESMHRRCDVYYGRHAHALLALSRRGLPFAYEAHAMPSTRHAEEMLKRLAVRRGCRGIVCISEQLSADLQQLLPRGVRTVVLRDAANPAPEAPTPVTPWRGRAGAVQVGYVGHLYPGKGVEMVAQLAQAMPDFDFHMVGGREEDIEHWREAVQAPNLLIHGFVPHAQLPGYYAHFDVLLLPLQAQVWIADKKTEIGRWTSPLKAFEYMSYGLPIVASKTPALEEIFVGHETALLVAPDSLEAWRDAVTAVAQDRALARALGESAQATFLAHHTWAQRARAICELLA